MAIDETYLSVLKSVLAQRDPDLVAATWTQTMCLSYPDLLVPGKVISNLFGAEITSELEVRSDGDQVKKYHSLPEDFGPLYETESLFEKLRIKTDFIDVKKFK